MTKLSFARLDGLSLCYIEQCITYETDYYFHLLYCQRTIKLEFFKHLFI